MTDILQEIDTFTEVHGAKGDGDLVSLLIRCRQEIEHLRSESSNEKAFNEGWHEHVGDLLHAAGPFVSTLKCGKPLNGSTLSLHNWKTLCTAYDAAVMALNLEREFPEVIKCQSPLGCGCRKCVLKFGPIHPMNIGKDLRSNPTGDVTSPRKA